MIIKYEELKKSKLEAEVNKYDRQCKEVMRDINLAAYVCKEGIPWCKNLSIQEIKKCLAYAHPCQKESSKVVLYKMHSDEVAFDICLLISNPFRKGFEVVIIEIQNKFHTRYSNVARLVSYIADAIVFQKGVAYEGDDYDSQWPINAIMIFKHPPKELENRVVKHPENNIYKESSKGHDFSICPVIALLHLGDENKADNESVRLLDIVYKGTDAKRIRETVKENFGFDLIEGGIEKMCDLGMGIVEETTEKVERQSNVKAIVNMMEEFGVSLDRAMKAQKISESEKPLYRELVNVALGE